MSKEIENLKNGVLNGDSVITNNHIQQQQQQQTKLNNNSNVDSTTKAIVGGRLQFYKDGKFILELARAREGEKTGWISVPRKTYWPPTISTNSSTTFSKHESSTSLSYSDDNSSIQSSPWQRDHCWKQSRPRHNISKEMAFFYNRPDQFCLTRESTKITKTMRRRPHNKHSGNVKFMRKKEKNGVDEASSESNDSDEKESSSQNDSKESIDTLDGNNKTNNDKNGNMHKLDNILKKLADRMASKLALNGNSMNGTHNHNNNNNNNSNGHHAIPTSYSLASHIANSINSQPHQHVSPRKRILRELEKVSLEDTKRSRSKSIVTAATAMTNGNGITTVTPPTSAATTHSSANGSLKTEKVTPPASRPISSYSITSLLAHTTSSSNSSNNSSNASVGCNNNNSINSNDSSSASHYHQQQQRLSLNSTTPPKSPSLMQNKRKSPNTTPPTQSPSPEHHAFHKYRPITTTPTSSSPYNSSYHSPNYMRGSPSPHDRLRTTSTSFSPSHSYVGTSSPHHNINYGGAGRERDSSLSPNVERNSSQRSTPTTTSTIRTVPKKTAALRQQFSSPTMESSSKMSKSSSVTTTTAQNVKNEKPMDVDALLRPSALIAPPSMPTSAAMAHSAATAAQLSHYPYMYSPLNYIPHAVSPYYHPSFYNPATMMAAAAAAAYRFPGAMSYPGPPLPGALSSSSPITSTSSSSSSPVGDRNGNGHQRNMSSSSPSAVSSTTTAHHHPYVHSSPWNPIPLTSLHHPDGNLIPKVKDEQHSDVPLNLSKH